jgi:hypothetical protein
MGRFSRDITGNNIQDNVSDTSSNKISASIAGDGDNYS